MTTFDRTLNALHTVVGIPVVPYASDGSIDLAQAAELADRLVSRGLGALTPNGNTGEFYALSPRERIDVLRTVTDAVGGRAVVIAGVGLDLSTATAEAGLAAELGAQAVMVHQPVLPYMSGGGWVDYVAAVAAAVPETAVVPYVSSTAISGADVSELVRRAPNVIALKYSVPDPVLFAETVQDVGGDLLWIAGLAESHAPAAWQAGARAFTSGLVNVAPEVSFAMLDALRAGDRDAASSTWRRIRRFEQLRARDRNADNVSVVKEAMHQLGLCDRSVRPPSTVVGESVRAEISEILAGWGAAS
ncbi:dihydrodipicolinate synthase family protein [Microbacterium betulae]|uniref:Dihydrodipicolinate synthase family protein n=1 Tax=Microbacterium betulae TaxID=2981139 RepID=A0AA97FIT0_9MICO|nr:dihydrodipicolinate synthase family protein [Microbacterium sp. AB]WOF23966.1 dihydrodipicolinate synthase family protein [Microbacterium sp. AB]